ncbi:MAG TPA: O-succinylbenzoate synthase, partial [Polyangiaceae bacterium]|nr:O-succinylbenzoate synthase [Polyangiaceae bacterium]
QARAQGVRVLVLKPMLLGLLGSLRLAEQARAQALDVVVSHSFDGARAMATARTLALVLGTRPFADGLGPHPALAAWSAKLAPHVLAPSIQSWTAKGLGILR